MNLVLSETQTLYFSISLIPNGKLLRVVAKRMSTVSLNRSKHLAILNYVKIVLLMREMISMTLEGKEKVFTRITWGELEGANSERGETTEFLYYSAQLYAMIRLGFVMTQNHISVC